MSEVLELLDSSPLDEAAADAKEADGKEADAKAADDDDAKVHIYNILCMRAIYARVDLIVGAIVQASSKWNVSRPKDMLKHVAEHCYILPIPNVLPR